jgi:hypothetical protein
MTSLAQFSFNDHIQYNEIQPDEEYLDIDLPIEGIMEDNSQQTQDISTNQQVIANIKDNYPFGNILENNKPNNHIRLYFKNINGAKNYNSWEIWEHACYTLKSYSVDIFGVSETNIKWNAKLRSEARAKCQKQDIYNKVLIDTSSSIDQTINNYQPGGTATLITNKWTGRATQPINDTSGMGRWSGYKLQTNTNTYLNVITVYRPTISKGLSTCYQQHISIMKRQGQHNPNPRQQLLDDLTNLIIEFNNNNDTQFRWRTNTRQQTDRPIFIVLKPT